MRRAQVEVRRVGTGTAEARRSERESPHHSAYDFIERAWFLGNDGFECWVSADPDFTAPEPVQREIFTAMVILDLLQDSRLSSSIRARITALLRRKRTRDGLHHFFVDETLLPADADCTGIANSLLYGTGAIGRDEAMVAVRKILANTDQAGIVSVYFTDQPSRKDIIDPTVCANALHFVALMDVHEGTAPSEEFLLETLHTRAYESGTRYYPSPDAFLYFLSRLVGSFPERYPQFAVPLRHAVLERQGANDRPLERAFRIAAADLLALPAHRERAQLSALQRRDGGWPADVFFRYGRSQKYFGSEALTTAFSLRALGR